jgi:hypothetical protein
MIKYYIKTALEIDFDSNANMKEKVNLLKNNLPQILLNNYPEIEKVSIILMKDSFGNDLLKEDLVYISRNIILSLDIIPKDPINQMKLFDAISNSDSKEKRFIDIIFENYSELEQVSMQSFIAIDFPPDVVKETVIGKKSHKLIGRKSNEVTTQNVKFLLDILTVDDITKSDINKLKEEIATIIVKYSNNSNKFKYIKISQIYRR